MSRTGLGKRSEGWVMECDGCYVRSEVRPLCQDFPLIEFADKGWLIGEVTDMCPSCVAKGKSVRGPYSRERLERDFTRNIEHCSKYYGRLPQSPALANASET